MTIIQNRFEIGVQLGKGGHGIVFQGRDMVTDNPVAIKLLRSEAIAHDPDLLERFAREAAVLRDLNHPNIVKVLATVEDHNEHFMVMEYVSGGDLGKLLEQRGPLPIAQTLNIALDLADALTRAHRLKIIHRDIKPANVLLADDGTPRLTDFGVAHIESHQRVTGTGVSIGTPDYMSPEILNGEPADARADIWSFGIVLFEMLTARRPFEGASMAQLMINILTQPPADLEALRTDAPIALVDLIYRMLEKDVERRISSVRHVGAALESIIQRGNIPEFSAKTRPSTTRFDTPTPQTGHTKNNLPAPTTPFIGRENELAQLTHLLSDRTVRLLTLIGHGGMGKTRLALEVATRLLQMPHLFMDGIYFVSLVPLTSAENIVPTIADALNLRFESGASPQEQLLDYFRDRSLLLILDNFEHLSDGVKLVNDILQTAPNLKVVATSRVRLNLNAETIFSLDGMDFPTWETSEDALQYSAIRLFMQCTRRARPDFELNAQDLKNITRICQLVHGVPLGIELAAVWVNMLSLEEIATEIERSFDFLESQMEDLPERHRSIHAVFLYSWSLLTPEEQMIFSKLAVFNGGFSRSAAQAVTGATLKQLTTLMNKSLIRRDPDTGRYAIHELLRQYAEAQRIRMDGADQIRDAHSRYYGEAIAARCNDLKGGRQQESVSDILLDIENVRGGFNWAITQGTYTIADLYVESLGLFYYLRSRFQDGIALFAGVTDTLEQSSDPGAHKLLGRVLTWQGVYHFSASEMSLAEKVLESALRFAQEVDDFKYTLLARFNFVRISHDLTNESANSICHEVLGQLEALGEKYYAAQVMHLLGYLDISAGKFSSAFDWTHKSYQLRKDIGDHHGLMMALGNLSGFSIYTEDWESVKRYVTEGLALAREIGPTSALMIIYRNAIALEFYRGHFDEGKSLIDSALHISREYNFRNHIAALLFQMSISYALQGDYDEAARLASETRAINQRLIGKTQGVFEVDYPCAIIAFDYLMRGDINGAEQLCRQAVGWLEDAPSANVAQRLCCVGMAAVRLQRGQPERALQIIATIVQDVRSPLWWQSREPLTQKLLSEIRSKLDADTHNLIWEQAKNIPIQECIRKIIADNP